MGNTQSESPRSRSRTRTISLSNKQSLQISSPTSLRSISSIKRIETNEKPPSPKIYQTISKTNINPKNFEIKQKKYKKKKKKKNLNNDRLPNNLPTLKARKSIETSTINNGVTGTYISSKVAKLSSNFWITHVANLERHDQLEIGCAIFFQMMTNAPIIRRKLQKKEMIEITSLRFLDMLTWLLNSLLKDNINLYQTLSNIGQKHNMLKITKNDYYLLIKAVHSVMEEYFQNDYEIDIKYSMEQALVTSTQIMTGDLKNLKDINAQIMAGQKANVSNSQLISFSLGNKLKLLLSGGFLKSYDICINSEIGREYLYRYLGQTWCSEVVVFLQLLWNYDKQDNDKGKFMIAKQIRNKCLTHGASFEINISYDCYTQFQSDMDLLETKFRTEGDLFKIKTNLMESCRKEIKKLVVQERWVKFVEAFSSMNIA